MTNMTPSIPMISAVFVLPLAVPLTAAQKEDSAPAKKNNSVYAELAKAPKKAAARRNPLERDPDAVAAGGKLFALHCAECHGEMAEGARKGPSLLADEVQQSTPGTLFWILTNGVARRGMPVWSSCRNRSASRS
jgi:mono/diheme cytochrome c family protein